MKKIQLIIAAFLFLTVGQSYGYIPTEDGGDPVTFDWVKTYGSELPRAKHSAGNSHRGEANYSYSIALPPTLLVPSLSLGYSSQAGFDREMAHGWNIDGLVEIRKPSERAYIQDGEQVYIISGPVSGLLKYDETNHIYRLYNGSAGANALANYRTSDDYWTVKTASGLTYILEKADATHSADRTALWRVTSCVDPNGNKYTCQYNSNHRLESIHAGALDGAEHSHIRLSFNYGNREHPYYAAGVNGVEEWDQVITNIAVQVDDGKSWVTIKNYDLRHESNGAVISLKGITVRGWNDITSSWDTLPETTFDYSEFDNEASGTEQSTGWTGDSFSEIVVNSTNYMDLMTISYSVQDGDLLDYNGDGLLDIVTTWGLTPAGSVYYHEVDDEGNHSFSSATHISMPTSTYLNAWLSLTETATNNQESMQVTKTMDLNNDGYPDLLKVHESNIYCWYGTGSGFESSHYVESAPTNRLDYTLNSHELEQMLDVNGDGWADFVIAIRATPEIKVAYHTGTKGGGWGTPETVSAPWLDDLDANGYGDEIGLSLADGSDETDYEGDMNFGIIHWAGFNDLNGDGFVDYIVTFGDRVGAADGHWGVYWGTGNGWSERRDWQSIAEHILHTTSGMPGTSDKYTFSQLMDVNVDGLPDFVLPNYWYRNNGDGFSTNTTALPSWIDGYLSKTTISSSNPDEYVHEETRRALDFNHDGIVDYLFGGGQTVLLAPYPGALRLITVKTGSGLTTELDYSPAADFYPSGNPSETQTMPRAMDVVTQIIATDEVSGQSATTQLEYAYGYCDQGIFCGFQKYVSEESATIVIDGATTTRRAKSETQYDLSQYLDVGSGFPTNAVIYSDANRNYAPDLDRGDEDLVPQRQTDWAYQDYGTHRLPSHMTTATYGEDGTSSTSMTTTLFYDTAGRLTTIVTDGGDGYWADTNDKYYYYAYETDADDLVARIRREETHGWDFISDDYREHNNITYRFDTDWNLTQKVYSAGNYYESGSITSQKVYIAFERGTRGEILSVSRSTDGVAYQTLAENEYAFHSAVLERTANSLGHETINTIDYRGRITSTEDPNGIINYKLLDGLDRVTQEDVKDLGGTSHLLKTHAYTTTTNLPFTTYEATYNGLSTPEIEIFTALDGLGQVYQTKTSHPENSSYVYADQEYDLFGNLLWSSHPYTSGTFGQHASSPSLLGVTYYDAFNQMRETHKDYENGVGGATVTRDDLLETIETDEIGDERITRYDLYGRIQSVEMGGKTLATYEYAPNDQLVIFTDANGNVTRYFYDAAGRLAKTESPDSGIDVFTYAYANILTHTNLAGGRIVNQYDLLDRLTNQTISNPIYGTMTNRWSYDAELLGKLDEQLDYLGFIRYDYDLFARPTNTTRHFVRLGPYNTNLTFSTTYDLLGNVVCKQYPSGLAFSNAYYHGKLQRQGITGGTYLDFVYDTYGHVTSRTNNLGMRWSYGFSDTPLFMDSQLLTTPMTTLGRSYLWEENGLLKEKQNHAVYGIIPSERYQYDPLQRLTHVEKYNFDPTVTNYTVYESFDYDDNGNLTSQRDVSGTNWSYTVGTGNRLSQRTVGYYVEQFSHDAAGCLTNKSGTIQYRYWYNGNRQLVKVANNNSAIAHYIYGADGELIAQAGVNPTNPAGFTIFFGDWRKDLSTNLVTEETGWGVYKNGTRRWYFKEYDGTPIGVFTDTGTNVAVKHFSAFGKKTIDAGENNDNDAFQAQEYKNNIGMYHLGVRHMNPDYGQWLQPEPKLITGIFDQKDPQKYSPYRYARNAPKVLADPTGYDPAALIAGNGDELDDISLKMDGVSLVGGFIPHPLPQLVGLGADIVNISIGVYQFAQNPSWSSAASIAGDSVGVLPGTGEILGSAIKYGVGFGIVALKNGKKYYDMSKNIPKHIFASQGYINPHAVDEIETLMKNGEWDWYAHTPVRMVRDSNGQMIVIDGHHRFIAAQRAGEEIPEDMLSIKDIGEPFENVPMYRSMMDDWTQMVDEADEFGEYR